MYARLVVLKLDPSFSHRRLCVLVIGSGLVWALYGTNHCSDTVLSHLSPLSSLRSTPLCTPRPDCSQMEWSLSMHLRGHYTTAESLPSQWRLLPVFLSVYISS